MKLTLDQATQRINDLHMITHVLQQAAQGLTHPDSIRSLALLLLRRDIAHFQETLALLQPDSDYLILPESPPRPPSPGDCEADE